MFFTQLVCNVSQFTKSNSVVTLNYPNPIKQGYNKVTVNKQNGDIIGFELIRTN